MSSQRGVTAGNNRRKWCGREIALLTIAVNPLLKLL